MPNNGLIAKNSHLHLSDLVLVSSSNLDPKFSCKFIALFFCPDMVVIIYVSSFVSVHKVSVT